MKKKKIVSLLLVATMALSMVACGKSADEAGKAASDNGGSSSDTPLVIGWDAMSQKFSPFFAESHSDMYLDDKCVQLELLKPDRAGQYILNGIDGYTAEYNGTEYTYYTPANIDVTENADGSVTYSIKLREDMKFSDGEPVTIDDVIEDELKELEKDEENIILLMEKIKNLNKEIEES